MTKETIDFSGVPEDIRSGGGNWLREAGDFLVKITKVEKLHKDNDRSNPPYYKWVFQVVSGDHKGEQVSHNTSLQPQALFNLRNLIYAVKGKNVAGKKLAFDPQSFVGEKIAITTDTREHNKKIYADVVDMRPADQLEAVKDEEEIETAADDEEGEEVEEELEDVDLETL